MGSSVESVINGRSNGQGFADRRFEQIIGNSPALESVLAAVEQVAPTDSTALVLGETGTGNPEYHGQATLARWKMSNPRVIHFPRQSDFWRPRCFKPKLQTFQKRLGGRVALAAEIDVVGMSILTYNLHLESRANDELRLGNWMKFCVTSQHIVQSAGSFLQVTSI